MWRNDALPGTHTEQLMVAIGLGIFLLGRLLMACFDEPSKDFVIRGHQKRRSKEPKAELIWAWCKPPLTWRHRFNMAGVFLWVGTIALNVLAPLRL